MIRVKAHKRKGFHVRSHVRDKWGKRANSNMPYTELVHKKMQLLKENNKIATGNFTWIHPGHRAFIARRLQAVNAAILKKNK